LDQTNSKMTCNLQFTRFEPSLCYSGEIYPIYVDLVAQSLSTGRSEESLVPLNFDSDCLNFASKNSSDVADA
jgi:hypothetical protein